MDKHEETRKKFQKIGKILLPIGAICFIIGIIDFAVAFNNVEPPKLFFVLFFGIPLMGIGGSMLTFGYRREIMKYHKDEVMPVFKESAYDVRDFVNVAFKSDDKVCKCGATYKEEDSFCSNCGTSLTKKCPKCSSNIKVNDKYCSSCGYKL